MKICAIIAEYNPFHNGHQRLLQFAKSNADAVVVIMSGNFTQRGMPACSDKYTRAKHAVTYGADAVVELPTIYATSSAQNFATGAIHIANAIGARLLAFGSECGDIKLLTECAQATLSQQFDNEIRQHLKMGVTYPKAVSMALPQYGDILDKPNNTLALEYIKALINTDSTIVPMTMERPDNYNLSKEVDGYASATALRIMDKPQAYHYAPKQCIDDMLPDIESNYQQFVATFMSTVNAEYLKQIEGISEGLENKFCKVAPTNNYEQLIADVKSKRYTQLKLQRIVLNAVLGITTDFTKLRTSITTPPIRLLAIKDNNKALLSHLCRIASMYSAQNNAISDIDYKADKLYSALSGTKLNKTFLKI